MQDKLDPSRLAALGGCPAGIHGQSEPSSRQVAAHDQAQAMTTCPAGLAATNQPESMRRRHVLGGLGAATAGLVGMTAQAAAAATGKAQHAAGDDSVGQVTDAPLSTHFQERVPYLGQHQAGIVTPRPSAGMLASFFVLAQDREELERLFRTLTKRIAFLTQGGKEVQVDPKLPPVSSGLLGPVLPPDALTITVSLGNSMFDERFGLAKVKPKYLQQMTKFWPFSWLSTACQLS